MNKSILGSSPSSADRATPRKQGRSRSASSAPSLNELAWWATPDAAATTIERGARAETRARRVLEAEGYEIVATNWRCRVGELDIVARDGDALVFVEVRSRDDASHGHAAEMVGHGKRRKVTRVAEVYLVVERPAFETCRFDIVAITGDEVALIKDAWRA